MIDGVPQDNSRVVAVYSSGLGKEPRSEWCLGTVSLTDDGDPVGCFAGDYNYPLAPNKRLQRLVDTSHAEPGEWCIVTSAFP